MGRGVSGLRVLEGGGRGAGFLQMVTRIPADPDQHTSLENRVSIIQADPDCGPDGGATPGTLPAHLIALSHLSGHFPSVRQQLLQKRERGKLPGRPGAVVLGRWRGRGFGVAGCLGHGIVPRDSRRNVRGRGCTRNVTIDLPQSKLEQGNDFEGRGGDDGG